MNCPCIIGLAFLCASAGLVVNCRETNGMERGDAETRRYDGWTLSEWRERMKSLDFKDSASAGAVPGLAAIALDRDAPWFSRRQAAETLGRLIPLAPEGLKPLVSLLEEKAGQQQGEAETSARVWAIKAIGLAGPAARSAAPELIAILKSPSEPLMRRQLALEAVSQIGPAHPSVLPTIIDLLSMPPEASAIRPLGSDAAELRELAVETFTLLGPRGAPAIPALLRLSREPSDLLRFKVAQALGAMGGRGEIAVPTLVEMLLLDDSALVRDAAADALGRIAGEGLTALTQLLGDAEPGVRWRAAKALGGMASAGRPARDELERLLQDESSEVRITACEALWKVTSQSEPALSAAIIGLEQDDRQLRIRAFRLIVTMGAKAKPGRDALRKLERHPDPATREAARKALQRMAAL